MKKMICSKNAPDAIGPYSHAVMTDKMIYISGQLPVDKKTGAFAGEDIKTQTYQSISNIKTILEEIGCGLVDVVKTTVFLNDMNNFAMMNEVYEKCFAENLPARSVIQVARLPKDALVEIEAIAYKE
jgi:endoribonuclease L-PSP, putative